MAQFYQPDLSENIDSPFIRDGNNKLVRRSYWLDMNDRTLVVVMTNGIGAHLTNEEKRAHLTDLRRPPVRAGTRDQRISTFVLRFSPRFGFSPVSCALTNSNSATAFCRRRRRPPSLGGGCCVEMSKSSLDLRLVVQNGIQQ